MGDRELQYLKAPSHDLDRVALSVLEKLADGVVLNQTTQTFTSDKFKLERYGGVSIFVSLASVSSGNDLRLKVEFSPDEGASWYADSVVQSPTAGLADLEVLVYKIDVVGNHVISVPTLARWGRVVAQIGGTIGAGSSLTFSLSVQGRNSG